MIGELNMKTIYKYRLNLSSEPQEINMPWVSEVVNVVAKADGLFLYALVEPDSSNDFTRKFCVYGTGWDIQEENVKYINSFLVGNYEIYHVFEVLD
jgi:hypothetical protein